MLHYLIFLDTVRILPVVEKTTVWHLLLYRITAPEQPPNQAVFSFLSNQTSVLSENYRSQHYDMGELDVLVHVKQHIVCSEDLP